MITQEKLELRQRTYSRNESIWVPMDWGRLMAPLSGEQAIMDELSRGYVENFLAVSDEAWEIKENQRDRSAELEQDEVAQQRQIADDKVALGRQQLAIKMATDAYVLAVRVYDAKVRAMLMTAREYAAQVEREQLFVERDRAQLAVAQEVLHRDEVNAKVYYEIIQRAQVEVDIAKAQVEVAQANVRAVMADIAAGEADIKVVQAQTEMSVAQADKAMLQADVARIFAQILTMKLSAIKLDVGKQEIAEGFAFIQTHLEDMLNLWGTKTLTEQIEAAGLEQIAALTNQLLTAEEASEDLKLAEAKNEEEIFNYQVDATQANLEAEAALTASQVVAKNLLADARLNSMIQERDKQTWAKMLINAAQRWVYKNHQEGISSVKREYQYITGGTS